jgi:hypothetical protein
MHGALFSILIVAAIFDPAIVARELGEVSTDGRDHPLRTPAWRAVDGGSWQASPGVDAGGAADTEGDH